MTGSASGGDRPGAPAPGLARLLVTPLDDAGAPSGPTVDLGLALVRMAAAADEMARAIHSAFVPALEQMFAAFSRFVDDLARSLGVDQLKIALRLNDLYEYWAPSLGVRYAVAHMGLTEVDVRSCDGTVVRLWNHRRVPLDDGFRDWALVRCREILTQAIAVESAFGGAVDVHRAMLTDLAPLRRYGVILPAGGRWARLRRGFRRGY